MKRTVCTIWLVCAIISLLAHAPQNTDAHTTIQEIVNNNIQQTAITDKSTVYYSFTLNMQKLPEIPLIAQEPQLPALVKSFVIPAKSAELEITKMTTNVYTLQGELKGTNHAIDPKMIYLQQSFTFKEARGFSVFIDLFSQTNEEIHVITEASFTLHGSGSFDIPSEVSEAFYESYRTLFANIDSSYLVGLQFKKPSLLILSHTVLNENSYYNSFINWKRASGFDVNIIYKTEAGENATNLQLKALVAAKYNELVNKPDFLLIVGGARAGNTYLIPPFNTASPGSNPEIVATDLDYSLIEDDDYFPEMIIGRFSASNFNDINVITSKTTSYEKATAANTNNWLNRATLVAANYASADLQPVTPIITSRWMAEKLRNIGYSTTEIYYPEGTPNDITTAVNQGCSILAYRGWGSSNGWALPQYQISNVGNLNNGDRLPVVYSIVCGTGDYVHATNSPCFGEQWISVGTTSQPKGAIGFVGPTYLHTSTDYNNSLASGAIWGITYQGLRMFGSTVMRGKIEMYNNFPREIGLAENVPFYWRTYNILSDPSLNMWVNEPAVMNVTLPTSVATHENAIEINAPGIAYGHVTATRNNNNFTFARIINGHAILPLPNTDSGANIYSVTITARNFKPVQSAVPITAEAGLGVVDHAIIGGYFMAGHEAMVRVSVKNFGTTDITSLQQPPMTSNSPFVESIEWIPANIDVPAGAIGSFDYNIMLTNDCPDDIDIPFYIDLQGYTAKIAVTAGGYVLEITSAVPQNAANTFEPGDQGDVLLTIVNPKSFAVEGLTGRVSTTSTAITITNGAFNLSSIDPGDSTTATFAMSVGSQCFIGRIVTLQVDFLKNDQIVATSHFTLTIGSVDATTVTGPDNYGYYAYDSFDTRYGELAPTYNWVEIPTPYESVSLPDDSVQTINLPFEFRFYGAAHNSISLNDNGWASFGETYNIDFRNWSIPSVLGPKNMLAVFWDDLKGEIIPETVPVEYTNMQVKYWHDTANNRFVITWEDGYFSQDTTQGQGKMAFQIILIPRNNDDGDVVYQYNRIMNYSQNRNYSTVGIQNADHTDGICYSFSNYYQDSASPLQDGLAIKFTTQPPDPYSESDVVMGLHNATLHQNYPNPFNPSTQIAFNLSRTAEVTLTIYNVKGQRVKTLLQETREPGRHTVQWNGLNDDNLSVTSGLYFYRLQTSAGDSVIRKMLLLK